MNKLVRLLGLTTLVTVSAFGQRGGGFHGGGGMHGGGFHGGMGGFHGGMGGFHGGMGGFHGGGFHGGGFHGGFGHGFASPGFHHGFHNGFHHGFDHDRFFFHSNPFFFHSSPFFGFGLGFGAPWGWGWGGVPWGGGFYGSALYPYPAYGSTYYDSSAYDSSYPYPSTSSPNVTVIYPPDASDYGGGASAPAPSGATPSAVINEYHWGSSSNVEPASKPVHFSIALTNNSTIDALAYWVDGNTLRYLDIQGRQQQVPLSQVDRARSQQLNRDRGIDFGLPKSG